MGFKKTELDGVKRRKKERNKQTFNTLEIYRIILSTEAKDV